MLFTNLARLAFIPPASAPINSRKKPLLALCLCLLNCSFFPPVAIAQDPDALRKTYQQVIDSYPQQLEAARKEGQRGLEAQLLASAGMAYQFLGNYQKAISFYQEGLAIAKSLPDPAIMEQIVNRLGTAYSKMGDEGGISFFNEQLKQARASGDRTLIRILLKYLGLAYLSLSDSQKVIEVYEEYLPLVRASKNRTEEVQALAILSSAYSLVRQLEKQVTLLQEQLTISQEIGNLSLQISALLNLIYAYQNLNRDQDAIASAEQAVQLAHKAADSYQEAFALQQLALLHGRLGNSDKLIALLEASLAISQKNNDLFSQAFTLQYLSTTYGFLGNYAKAIDLQNQGLAIYKKLRQQGLTSLELAEIYSLSNLAIQQYKSGQLTEAETNLKLALKAYSQVGKDILGNTNLFAMTRDELNIGIRENIADIYRTLQKILIATNRTNEALEIAEAAKARAFIDLLTFNLGATPQSPQAIPELTLEQMRQIAKAQNSTLVQYSLAYQSNVFSVVRLGKQPAYENALYIWVIKPTGEIYFRQSNLEPIWLNNEKAQSFYSRFTSLVIDTRNSIFLRSRGVTSSENTARSEDPASPRQTSQKLQQLHQILIKPIAELLPTDPHQRVTFIPQSALFLVPFPALQDANGKYLIEKHTILTAPSIQVLDFTHKQRQRLQTSPNQNALVAGNPTMPSLRSQPGEPLVPLPSLPDSEAEAKAIASLLKTQPLIGPQATESAVVQQMQNARFIHFATHGLLDNIAGFQSSLAFAPAPPLPGQKASETDGFLTAREIINLKLKAELVVLSACDTGRGRISGDGVIGLSRSFIAAGASSVIVSLWKVPDKPTSELMLLFYQNLQKKPDKAQALRQAMLATLEKYPSPRDWAAFTLIGEAD